MKKIIVILLVSISLIVGCSKSEAVKEISVYDLKKRIKADADIQILDVRTESECSEGIINNAFIVNVLDESFESKVSAVISKDKKVYVYCRSGGRALKAAEILKQKGFDPINIEGGYKAWEAKIALIK